MLRNNIKIFLWVVLFLSFASNVFANNIYTKKIDLNPLIGSSPYGSLSLLNDKFYGMTNSGGIDNYGAIFEWDPVLNVYTKKIDFTNNIGIEPYGSMTFKDGKFYGMTFQGGLNNSGVIFEWDPNTNNYVKKFDLNNITGKYPYGDLTLYQGKFYGMTNLGGVNSKGTIFEWDPVSNIFTKKFDFNGTLGSYPKGSLVLSNGKFYGMTYRGGLNNLGVIFEWDPTSNIFNKKFDFSGVDSGNYPYGNLTLKNNKFYGMTAEGGKYDQGIIFEWNPSTNVFIKKIDFDYLLSGSYPYGTLSVSGENLYGITSGGGVNDKGVIFEWNPTTNIYNKKIDLNILTGNYFNGTMSLFDGKFYGLMYQGGLNGKGTIFEWNQNIAPFANSLSVTGSSLVGSTLVGNYTYFDADNDPEGDSIYKWYRDGIGIDGSNSKTYTTKIEDIGKIIKFEVIPIAITGEKIGISTNATFSEVIKKRLKPISIEFFNMINK